MVAYSAPAVKLLRLIKVNYAVIGSFLTLFEFYFGLRRCRAFGFLRSRLQFFRPRSLGFRFRQFYFHIFKLTVKRNSNLTGKAFPYNRLKRVFKAAVRYRIISAVLQRYIYAVAVKRKVRAVKVPVNCRVFNLYFRRYIRAGGRN